MTKKNATEEKAGSQEVQTNTQAPQSTGDDLEKKVAVSIHIQQKHLNRLKVLSLQKRVSYKDAAAWIIEKFLTDNPPTI